MNLIEYLNIDISTEKGVNEVFGYVDEHLGKLYENNAAYHLAAPLKRIYSKIVECIEFYGKTQEEYEADKMYEQIDKLNDFAEKMRKGLYLRTGDLFFKPHEYLYTKTLEIHDDITEELKRRNTEDIFNKLLDNNISAKEKMVLLLNNSIKLIESNPTLPDKAKRQIVGNITSAINEAESKKTNWSKFLGKVSQAIMLLAAIAAISGYDLKDITEAKGHLEGVVNIIQETTVNNIKVTNELNIQNNIQIVDSSNKKQIDEPK